MIGEKNTVRGLYWEEWEPGREWESPARTIGEAEISAYAGLSGDYNPLHVNEEYARTTIFGTRVAHGPLVYAIAAGLLFQLHLYDDTLIALLGFENLKFTGPVRAGDTVHAKIRVLDRRETSKPDRGIVRRELRVFNQRGECVQEAIQTFLIKRSPTEEGKEGKEEEEEKANSSSPSSSSPSSPSSPSSRSPS